MIGVFNFSGDDVTIYLSEKDSYLDLIGEYEGNKNKVNTEELIVKGNSFFWLKKL